MLYKYIQIYLDSIHTYICIYVTSGVAKGRTRSQSQHEEHCDKVRKNQSEYEVQTGLHKNRHLSTQAMVTAKAVNTPRHSGGNAGHQRSRSNRCPQISTTTPYKYKTSEETCCFRHVLGALTSQIKDRCRMRSFLGKFPTKQKATPFPREPQTGSCPNATACSLTH